MTDDTGGQALTVESLRAGVDWLTITVQDDGHRRELFSRWNKTRQMLEERFGVLPRKWYWHGYVGLSVSGMDWGTRDNDCILRVHGDLAHTYWKLFVRLANHVTRVDLAVTCQVSPKVLNLPKTYYVNLDSPRARNWTHIENSRLGGATLYVGSRQSEQYGRIYDKGVESQQFPAGKVWRYEVEYKAEAAQAVSNYLMTATCPRVGPTPHIRATVYKWFDDRGIPPLFGKSSGPAPLAVSYLVRDENFDRKMHWLRTQVGPAISPYIHSRKEVILEALGLGDIDAAKWSPSI